MDDHYRKRNTRSANTIHTHKKNGHSKVWRRGKVFKRHSLSDEILKGGKGDLKRMSINPNSETTKVKMILFGTLGIALRRHWFRQSQPDFQGWRQSGNSYVKTNEEISD